MGLIIDYLRMEYKIIYVGKSTRIFMVTAIDMVD